MSLERLDVNADGDLLYTFTHSWSDGTTGIKLSPLELLEKLAALVPLPRLHQVVSRIALAVRWLLGATQHIAGGHHPDAAPARAGRARRPSPCAELDVGTAAQAHLRH